MRGWFADFLSKAAKQQSPALSAIYEEVTVRAVMMEAVRFSIHFAKSCLSQDCLITRCAGKPKVLTDLKNLLSLLVVEYLQMGCCRLVHTETRCVSWSRTWVMQRRKFSRKLEVVRLASGDPKLRS
jgi:hypothetical protein